MRDSKSTGMHVCWRRWLLDAPTAVSVFTATRCGKPIPLSYTERLLFVLLMVRVIFPFPGLSTFSATAVCKLSKLFCTYSRIALRRSPYIPVVIDSRRNDPMRGSGTALPFASGLTGDGAIALLLRSGFDVDARKFCDAHDAGHFQARVNELVR